MQASREGSEGKGKSGAEAGDGTSAPWGGGRAATLAASAISRADCASAVVVVSKTCLSLAVAVLVYSCLSGLDARSVNGQSKKAM